MGHSRPLSHYFRLFNTVYNKQIFNTKIANDWIRTADLWYRKQPLYQLSQAQQQPIYSSFYTVYAVVNLRFDKFVQDNLVLAWVNQKVKKNKLVPQNVWTKFHNSDRGKNLNLNVFQH